MSESEEKESVGSTVKNTIIGVVVTMVTAVGGYVTTQFEKIMGIEDDTEQSAPAQSQSNNQSVIINIPEQKPSTQTIIREVPVETKKDTVVAPPPAPPSARDRLLNRNKSNN